MPQIYGINDPQLNTITPQLTDVILIENASETGKCTLESIKQILCADGWGEPKGGYLFDGVNDYVSVPYTQKTKGFSIWVKPTANTNSILNFGTNLDLSINSSNVLTVGSGITNAAIYVNGKATTTIALNVWNYIFVVCDEFTSTVLEIGRYSTSYYSGFASLARMFNRTYTLAEIITMYNNGLQGQNALPFADAGANNTELVTGDNSTFASDTGFWIKDVGITIADGVCKFISVADYKILHRNNLLVKNKVYRLTFDILNYSTGSIYFGPENIARVVSTNADLVSGNDVYFRSNGSKYIDFEYKDQYNTGNFWFYALNQPVTLEIDNVLIKQIGCVTEYLPENAGTLGWIETQNALHGQTSGSPILLNNSKDITDVKTLVTGNTTLTSVIPKRYLLKRIIVENTTANAYTLNVGSSTSGSTDVVNGATISASTLTTITINKIFSMTTAQTLYLQSASWNSSSSSFYLDMELI